MIVAIIRGTPGNDLLYGTRFDDDIFAFAGNDTVRAGNGDDYVEGADGNDLLYGDAGNDWLVGGRGVDSYFGGTGFDAADFSFDATGSTGGVTLDLGRTVSSPTGPYSVATVRTPGGTYTERLNSIEDVLGSLGNDVIAGTGGSNVLLGDAGNDRLSGAGSNDTVSGEAGNDTVSGGSGNDVVDGGAGNDRLDGGAGRNRIVTGAGSDTIVFRDNARSDDLVDFNSRVDTLLIDDTGEPPGTTFRQLVRNGTIDVFFDGVDTLLEYGGSDILLFNVRPGELNNGNVLIE
jgi:Ca2+-binding RTX toxin-like protein